jgi:hypothetical protein
MAEQEKPKLDLPWGTLLPLIAALAGIIVQYQPLVSERPASPGEKAVELVAEQDVDARLWQDPLAVARKEKEAHEAERAKSSDRGRHEIQALARAIRDGADRAVNDSPDKDFPDHILLLAVMLDAGPYVEQEESRLRARQAVLEALSEGKFVPVDGEHIGFVTLAPWPPDTTSSGAQGELLLPWERCEAADKDTSLVYPRKTRSVFVLWLPAANFDPVPLTRFALLVHWLTQDSEKVRNNIDIKLIGPLNSGGLQNMIREVLGWRQKRAEAIPQGAYPIQTQMQADAARDDALHDLWIISPRATISNDALFYGPLSRLDVDLLLPGSYQSQPPLKESVEEEEEIKDAALTGLFRDVGLRFVRTITTEDLVLSTLIDELEKRGVDVAHEHQNKWDKVVILTEWDSPYGRSLAMTFAASASGRSYASLVKEPEKKWPKWILHYRYLRGIDGRLPGEQAKKSEPEANQKKQSATVQPKAEEATEGMDQSDYVRRLASDLKKKEVIWQRRGGGVRAIGLLGSDVYDKLMILRALRPEFPDAIFFTNNLDAHFERRADWVFTHNLVIASPFGSKLPRDLQRNLAPFRDNIQTSMYAGTLVATGLLDKDKALELAMPKVFEISRHGAYDFDAPPEETHWFLDWLHTSRRETWLILSAIWLLVVAVWLKLAVINPKPAKGSILRSSFNYLFCDTPLWLGFWVPVLIFGVSFFAQTRGYDEPLAFFSGISIWPAEMLRLIAILLVLHFMIKASFCLKANEREVAERFCLGNLKKGTSRWTNFWEGLKRWQTAHATWLAPGAEFSAEEAWHAYLRRNQFWPRFVRVALISLLFGFGILLAPIFRLFTKRVAAVPVRGVEALAFHSVLAICLTIAVIVISFYVVDAIQLNGNFIRLFTHGLTKWPSVVSQRCKRMPPLSEEELSGYHDVFFVAQRTEAVARLIWYPLIVLAVILVARSSFFDNWTWFPRMILLFAVIATLSVGSAMFLRRAAERLRQTALDNLQLARAAHYAVKEKQQTFDELIAEIRGLKKGAFAPLSEQHFIRAILVPSGTLGLLAVAQRLLEIF